MNLKEYIPECHRTCKKAPVGRSNHGVVSYNGFIYMYGGRTSLQCRENTFYRLNLQTKEWERIFSKDKLVLPKCSAFSLTADRENGKIYLLGGLNNKQTFLKTLYEYDIKGNRWTKKPNSPFAFVDHDSVCYKGKLYAFGGENSKDGRKPSTLFCFDPKFNEWQKLISKSSKRFFKTHISSLNLSIYLDNIVMFGGMGEVGSYNAIYLYNISTNCWTRIKKDSNSDSESESESDSETETETEADIGSYTKTSSESETEPEQETDRGLQIKLKSQTGSESESDFEIILDSQSELTTNENKERKNSMLTNKEHENQSTQSLVFYSKINSESNSNYDSQSKLSEDLSLEYQAEQELEKEKAKRKRRRKQERQRKRKTQRQRKRKRASERKIQRKQNTLDLIKKQQRQQQKLKSPKIWPEKRMGHVSGIYGNKLFVLTGYSPIEFKYLEDCWVFDLVSKTWKEIQLPSSKQSQLQRIFNKRKVGGQKNIAKPKRGARPFKGRIRSKLVFEKDSFWIVGGYTNHYTMDVWELEILKNEFETDMKNFLHNDFLADYKIISKTGTEYPIHSSLIQARLKKTKIGSIVKALSQQRDSIISNFLLFLYTGSIDFDTIKNSKEIKKLEKMFGNFGLPLWENYSDKAPNKLSQDIGGLLKTKKGKDFTIYVDNKPIHVHKQILCSRSELYRGMFECVSECNGRVSDYSRKSFHAVQALITFIYTGKTEHITPYLALELLDAVGYYGMNENSILKKFTKKSSQKLSKWKIRKFYKNQKKLELKKEKSNQNNAKEKENKKILKMADLKKKKRQKSHKILKKKKNNFVKIN
ncbi:leucine-zipper-like transcriptional regulator 1 [Anaeramoeba flamelloides]|uniref:Leucine-zipper-like transcriptional regulator 1 n=1 Tax=Anaeramoeba flamelloides TaxID=1746091 RepID=A0ABQ8Z645_9EUKA|nr:leucine-zipper-like transcriptional regulator 1 [Anaeramoeba flamelloides]